MDIIIRDLSPSSVATLDEMAKRKKMSRNSYLRTYLESLAISGEIQEVENKYADLVNAVADVVADNNRLMHMLISKLERIQPDEENNEII